MIWAMMVGLSGIRGTGSGRHLYRSVGAPRPFLGNRTGFLRARRTSPGAGGRPPSRRPDRRGRSIWLMRTPLKPGLAAAAGLVLALAAALLSAAPVWAHATVVGST